MKTKITFLVTKAVKDHSGKIVDEFEKGKSYDLVTASAERWLRRGVAELTTKTKATPRAKVSE